MKGPCASRGLAPDRNQCLMSLKGRHEPNIQCLSSASNKKKIGIYIFRKNVLAKTSQLSFNTEQFNNCSATTPNTLVTTRATTQMFLTTKQHPKNNLSNHQNAQITI